MDVQTKFSPKEIFSNYRLLILLILGITIGCIIGVVFGADATVLKPLGDIFLNLMFTAVVPLVFFSLVSSIIKMSDMKRLGNIMNWTLVTFVITGIIASVFIIIILTLIPPAAGVVLDLPSYTAPEPVGFLQSFAEAVTVNDFNKILSRSAMLPLVIFSLLFGYCLKKQLNETENSLSVIVFFDVISEACIRLINIIMYYAPIGLGAYFATLVGTYGSDLVSAYSKAILMFFPICIAYFLIFFTLYVFYAAGKNGVILFYKNILPSVLTSLATQSSLATLPTNLAVTQKLGVKKDVASIILPVGATIHMDGTVLTTLMKIAFAFGVFGLEFNGISVWIPAILLSVMSGVVMSGIPGGGMMGSLIIVAFYGFPPEIIPVIVTIGMLTDAIATMINSTGDVVSCMIVSKKVDADDWLDKKVDSGEITV